MKSHGYVAQWVNWTIDIFDSHFVFEGIQNIVTSCTRYRVKWSRIFELVRISQID